MSLPRRGARAAIILTAFLLLAAPSAPVLQRAEDIAVSARPIPRFDTSSAAGKRFGGLDYVGGFSYTSRSPFLEGVSSIRMLKSDRFLAVTDTGLWFAGRIERDEKGAPVGMSEAHLSPILGPGGQPPRRKGEADAEGLGLDNNGDALVSFEINHRIAVYRDARNPFASTPRFLPLPIPRKELRFNAGLETIATAPANSPLKGRTITVSEASVDENGDLFAGILGPGGGVFKIRRDPIWSATDGAFLPDGDFLLLERRFQGYTRVGMRIRRIDGRSIRPGAVVDGSVLMEATLAQEIDNMEGLDTYRAPDGSIRLVLVSDDNSSFFQRNLFLEFKLVENAAAAIQ